MGNVTKNKSVVKNTAIEVKTGSALNFLANIALVGPEGVAANITHKEVTVLFIPSHFRIIAKVTGINNNFKNAIIIILQSKRLLRELISAI